MKTLILGDIHGRLIWYEIIQKEQPDKIIFLGDYVSTHELITAEQQLSNLEDILNYKEENPNKVILLRGNHDICELGYHWAICSGRDKKVFQYMSESTFKERFLKLTQWIYINEELKIIFSHAGISQIWMNNSKIKNIYDINDLEPSKLFGFTPNSLHDMCGTSKTQPLTWIRPRTLCECNIPEYDQVVGHTPQEKISKLNTKNNQIIWLCDSLLFGNYLVIEDNKFIPKSL